MAANAIEPEFADRFHCHGKLRKRAHTAAYDLLDAADVAHSDMALIGPWECLKPSSQSDRDRLQNRRLSDTILSDQKIEFWMKNNFAALESSKIGQLQSLKAHAVIRMV